MPVSGEDDDGVDAFVDEATAVALLRDEQEQVAIAGLAAAAAAADVGDDEEEEEEEAEGTRLHHSVYGDMGRVQSQHPRQSLTVDTRDGGSSSSEDSIGRITAEAWSHRGGVHRATGHVSEGDDDPFGDVAGERGDVGEGAEWGAGFAEDDDDGEAAGCCCDRRVGGTKAANVGTVCVGLLLVFFAIFALGSHYVAVANRAEASAAAAAANPEGPQLPVANPDRSAVERLFGTSACALTRARFLAEPCNASAVAGSAEGGIFMLSPVRETWWQQQPPSSQSGSNSTAQQQQQQPLSATVVALDGSMLIVEQQAVTLVQGHGTANVRVEPDSLCVRCLS